MSRRTIVTIAILMILFAGCTQPSAPPMQGNYSFMWWAHGWRGRSPADERIMCFQTDRYGLAIDVEHAAVTHCGVITDPLPYREAVAQDNDVIFSLPEADLTLTVESGGIEYTCVHSATFTERVDAPQKVQGTGMANYPVRIIDSGRLCQRMDIQRCVFEDADGSHLPATGRLEVTCWPDRAGFVFDLVPEQDLAEVTASIALTIDGNTYSEKQVFDAMSAGERHETVLAWDPSAGDADASQSLRVTVTDPADGSASLPVDYDPGRGWHHVDMSERSWSIAEEPDRLDRLEVMISNDSDTDRVARLNFAFEGNFPGITGMSPMLRDEAGIPTGIQVQISKNWHQRQGYTFLYQGPWFHGLTMIEVPAGGEWRGEFDIAYARWGGVPAASHAQLCLIGWGTNQLWEEIAIGSWGESICYDPDVNLNRSIIDDVRPLMVWAMRDEPTKWSWTNNVGGGDFLHYETAPGEQQYLTRMRSQYERYGPCLTEVTYAGVSADGAIAARITVMTPRTDDINRAWHRFRYDVLKPVAFERLAFYQVGSDRYNDHYFDMMARGTAEDGLTEEWNVVKGGLTYHRTAIPCEGEAPWFSLHGGYSARENPRGAWADRGLVIREWNACIDGADVPHPFAAVYGTENGFASANVEIVPPPGVTTLSPGDYIEGTVELLILPQSGGDYYGPNDALAEHLAAHGGTWRSIQRQSEGNRLTIDMERGTLVRTYPPVIAVDGDRAEFTLEGGLAYVPLTFTGLSRRTGITLSRITGGRAEPIDQSVHGNDFWQTEYDRETGAYTVTFNVPADTSGDERGSVEYVLAVE